MPSTEQRNIDERWNRLVLKNEYQDILPTEDYVDTTLPELGDPEGARPKHQHRSTSQGLDMRPEIKIAMRPEGGPVIELNEAALAMRPDDLISFLQDAAMLTEAEAANVEQRAMEDPQDDGATKRK